jgi:NCAIR mutase (PurE)-related protein
MPMSIKDILDGYRQGSISAKVAEDMLRMDYLEKIGTDVLFDVSRQQRTGIPEIVYASSKDRDTVVEIALAHRDRGLLISKAPDDYWNAVDAAIPGGCIRNAKAKTIFVGRRPEAVGRPIGIMTAGTSDIPVAEEAKEMAAAMGVRTVSFYDLGVAGMHRMTEPMKKLIEADVCCIIAVAGMEGAFPTVVSSLSTVPVIGVPTSTGYGFGGDGEAALMCMLQTCSPGLSVVNVDNGIGAGAMASMIAKQCNRRNE